jgi:hypothetical protein
LNNFILQLKRFPLEWQDSLFSDSKMLSIYKYPDINMSIEKCEVNNLININDISLFILFINTFLLELIHIMDA